MADLFQKLNSKKVDTKRLENKEGWDFSDEIRHDADSIFRSLASCLNQLIVCVASPHWLQRIIFNLCYYI